jgi:hypothetical protein
MTTEFADYVAQQDARNTIELNIHKWSLMLCEALKHNYIEYSIKMHKRSIDFADSGDMNSVHYHEACIEKLKNGKSDYDFIIESGRRYHKIVMANNQQYCLTLQRGRSSHAFVDKKTGSVYKPASFKAPAKHERFNLCLIKDREWLLENADWSGSYLYKN